MAKSIFKYQLRVTDIQQVELPINAEILTVQTQHETPCIWAKVNPKEDTEYRTFRIIGTGHPISESEEEFLKYIGTFQLQGGSLVFHLFQLIK